MARASVKAALLVSAALVLAAPAAQGAMAVFDGSMVGKAIEQIKAMQEQIKNQLAQLSELKQQVGFLNEISGLMDEVSNAIGSITHITLPIPNLDKIKGQIKSDARCLMPDGAGWGIKFTDLNFGSICDTSTKYLDALFLDDKQMKDKPFTEQAAARNRIDTRRTALLADTSTRALAQADVQMKQAEELNATADSLQSALGNASTVQDRLHVLAQTEIAQTRALAAQTQILAQMLKLHSAAAIKAGIAPDSVKDVTEAKE
ncbi:hypothetical protein [Magnetospirillum molischianum]|nr:hypothetical protein [Magnetospirillum molischianum]